jgi:hypothetical protein
MSAVAARKLLRATVIAKNPWKSALPDRRHCESKHHIPGRDSTAIPGAGFFQKAEFPLSDMVYWTKAGRRVTDQLRHEARASSPADEA